MHRVDSELKNENGLEEIHVLAYVLSIWIRLIAPFTPHTCEELWNKHGGYGFVSEVPWPEYYETIIDMKVQKGEEVIQELVGDIKEIQKITKRKSEKIHVYLAPDWKWKVFDIANQIGKPDISLIMGKSINENVYHDKKELAVFVQKIVREMTRVNYVGRLDEERLLKDSLDYVAREAGANVIVYKEPHYDPQEKSRNAIPYKPAIYIE